MILTNARLVLPDRVQAGTVVVREGCIVEIDSEPSRAPGAIDCEQDFVVAGIIDVHTDNLERHLEPRPGVNWPNMGALVTHDRQCAAAGITTVFDSLCVGEFDNGRLGRRDALVRSLQAMEQAQADGLLKSEHLLHLRCEVSAAGVVDAFVSFVDDPLVRLVSVMDHTPGQRQWWNLEKWKEFNRKLDMSDRELDMIVEERRRRQQNDAPQARRIVIDLCRSKGLALASHDDTTPEHIEEAVADGVSISEFPTTEEAARLARRAGLWVIMGGPNVVLGGSHSGNVSARALAAAGMVDGLASDYVPMSLIHGAFLFHEVLGIDLPAAMATVSANPARMVGLDDRGTIAPGNRADLVRVRAYRHMPVILAVWRGGVLVA